MNPTNKAKCDFCGELIPFEKTFFFTSPTDGRVISVCIDQCNTNRIKLRFDNLSLN